MIPKRAPTCDRRNAPMRSRQRRDGSISRERRSSSGGRKEDGRSPTLRGISQDEHESITCSSRLTFILGLANERIPSFQFVLLFPLQSSGGTSVPHIPLLFGPVELPSPRGRSVSRTRTRPLPHHRPTRIIVEHVTSGRCRFEAMSFANLSLARFLRRGAYRKTSFPDSFDPC
mgnify:CR=1 FL=1